jgi:hypothetical protein
MHSHAQPYAASHSLELPQTQDLPTPNISLACDYHIPLFYTPIVLPPLFLQACDFLALVRFHMPMDFPLFFRHVIICLSKMITQHFIFPLFSLTCDIFSYSALTNPSSKRKRMINQLTNPPQKDDESPLESSGRFHHAD